MIHREEGNTAIKALPIKPFLQWPGGKRWFVDTYILAGATVTRLPLMVQS
jgi:hypothetical protein